MDESDLHGNYNTTVHWINLLPRVTITQLFKQETAQSFFFFFFFSFFNYGCPLYRTDTHLYISISYARLNTEQKIIKRTKYLTPIAKMERLSLVPLKVVKVTTFNQWKLLSKVTNFASVWWHFTILTLLSLEVLRVVTMTVLTHRLLGDLTTVLN